MEKSRKAPLSESAASEQRFVAGLEASRLVARLYTADRMRGESLLEYSCDRFAKKIFLLLLFFSGLKSLALKVKLRGAFQPAADRNQWEEL